MSEQIKEITNNEKGFFAKAIGVVEDVAKASYEVEKLKIQAAHAVEDGMAEAQRLVKKGEYAAEDLMENTAHLIKHDPFRSVGINFGVGFGLGMLAVWLLTHQTTNNNKTLAKSA